VVVLDSMLLWALLLHGRERVKNSSALRATR
jgi:hypothetical protein